MESPSKVSVMLATEINGNLTMGDLKNVTYEAHGFPMRYHVHANINHFTPTSFFATVYLILEK